EHGNAGDATRPVARVLLHVARWTLAEMGRRHPSPLQDSLDLIDHRGCVRGYSTRVPADRRAQRTDQHRYPAGLRDRVRGRLGAARSPSGLAPALQDALGAFRADHGHSGIAAVDARIAGEYLDSADRMADRRHGHLCDLRT